jgi:ribonuclease P protein subunit RPR2
MTAFERIMRLFSLAMEDDTRKKRYVGLAKKISEKTRTRIPKEMKRRVCGKCGTLLSSKNSSVRIKKGAKVTACRECGNNQKIPLRPLRKLL